MDQHKVPKFCLKHFAGQDGMVWTYDKDSRKSWCSLPERTSVEAYYYSVEVSGGQMDNGLEALMADIESAAAPIYERLAEGIMPQGSDREAFGHFLGLMYARTPTMRRQAAFFKKTGNRNEATLYFRASWLLRDAVEAHECRRR